MQSFWPQLKSWIESGEPFALATVVAVSGSAPRSPGSCMAVSADGRHFLGSVSSGCLDAEVVEAARDVIKSSGVKRLRFGPDGNPPWSDGLTCGGWIDVRVDPWWGCHANEAVRRIGSLVTRWMDRDEAGVVLSDDEHHLAIDAGGYAVGEADAFNQSIVNRALDHLRGEHCSSEWGSGSSGSVFVRAIRRRPRLLVVGAVDVAVHLVSFARELGFAISIIDPREAFAVAGRFRLQPDKLIRAWPKDFIAEMNLGPRDASLVLTHDPKIDDPALLALLATNVGYIGALGSRRSHAARLERLQGAGADADSLARISGPAGIHLGTPNACGIALGIAAGIAQWQAALAKPAKGSIA